MISLLKAYQPLFYSQPETRYYLLTGGRGSGKSFSISLFLLNLTYEKTHVILYTRFTMVAAHISIIPEFLDKITLMNKEDDFNVTRNEIVNNKTGSRILFRGIKTSSGNQTANLKSIKGVTTYIIDEAEELSDETTFDTIDLSIRTKEIPNRVILIMNPAFKGHWIYKRFIERNAPECTLIHTTYLDNYNNLSASFIEQADRVKEQNPLRYRHLFMGEWLDEAEGLLWNRAMINRQRISLAPELSRTVVAIDPATTATSQSDETGIVVLAKDKGSNYYVLEDLSGKYSPAQWATVAVQAAKRHNADAIVAEKNQGGDMVETTIRTYDKQIRYIGVTATKGKAVRAEPIYSLYEQGKVWHIGEHPQLEMQMVSFNPNENKDSPDRVDALVWGLTELSGGVTWEFAVF